MTAGPTGDDSKQGPSGGTAVLRVLSNNVHRWGDDRTALARVVKACAPDVMLVQEAPTWWGTRRKRRAMAASFGMRYVVGSARNAGPRREHGRPRRQRRPSSKAQRC